MGMVEGLFVRGLDLTPPILGPRNISFLLFSSSFLLSHFPLPLLEMRLDGGDVDGWKRCLGPTLLRG